MAKIERYISTGVKTPSRGVVIPRPIQTPSGNTGIGDIGQGLTDLSRSMFQLNKAFVDARQVSELSSAKVKTIRKIAALESDFNKRQDDVNFVKDYDKQIAELNQDIYGTFSDEETKNAFAPYWEKVTSTGRLATEKLARNKFVTKAKGQLITDNQLLLESADSKADYDYIMTEIRPTAISAMQASVTTGVNNGDTVARMIANFDNDLWTNYIKTQSEVHPIGLKAALNDKNKFPGLDPNVRKALAKENDVNYAYAMSEDKGSYAERMAYVENMSGISEDAQDRAIRRISNDWSVEKSKMAQMDDELGKAQIDGLLSQDIKQLEEIVKLNRDPKAQGSPSFRKSQIAKAESEMEAVKRNQALIDGLTPAERTARDYKIRNNNTKIYTDWTVKVREEYETLSESEIIEAAKNPLEGGLTGEQVNSLGNLLARLKNQDANKAIKLNNRQIKSAIFKIKKSFNRGDFGTARGKAELTEKAKTIKADLLLKLDEWVFENEGKDPTDFVKKEIASTINDMQTGKVKDYGFLGRDVNMTKGVAREKGVLDQWYVPTKQLEKELPPLTNLSESNQKLFRDALKANPQDVEELRNRYNLPKSDRVTYWDIRAAYKLWLEKNDTEY